MYFESPKTLEELKNQFRKLALKFHPDRNMDDIEASTQAMKDINAEYEKLFDLLEKGLSTEEKKKSYHSLDDGYREVILKIMFLPNIIMELVGSWLWVSGKTFQVSCQLRAAGLTFSKTRKMWYFRTGEHKSHRGSKLPFEVIKARYGSEIIEKGYQTSLAG